MRSPYFASTVVIIALVAAAPIRAQAIADPARSPDAAFVAKASDALAADADVAALAIERATAPAVKAFARQVLDAHTVLARELAAMGRTALIPAKAEAPSTDAMKEAAALRTQPPRQFDEAFVAAMIARREAAVAMFEAESRDGRDAEVKEWAARQLPALRDQLVAARALRPRPSS